MKSGIRTRILPLFFLVTTASISSSLSGCASGPKSHTGVSNTAAPISKKEQIQYLLSVAAANIGDSDSISAIETLNKVRDLDDSVAECYYLYALAYLGKSELRLATESARYAIKLDPKYSAAKNTLGKLLLDQGKYDEAKKYLLESANDLLFREAYLPETNLGILFYKKMEFSQAELWLNRAIDDKSNTLPCLAYYYRGKLKMDRNELKQAERDLILGAKGNCVGMSETHVAYGKALVREKKYDEARAKFVEIQRLFPSSDVADEATQYLREIP